ncbi:hypothetical protein [Desmospora activa]|uniref:Uncharacterized protein n=1 Tax=Desmospora activa DSM 45169 TaxID=1121389 RepID=A0A2T4Z9F0_9BACL|nr:hypothetical protein [Desmospora activa]PTM58495.1 hypothetical protein C8J48_1078 [Desmospora activa DSM 45169]
MTNPSKNAVANRIRNRFQAAIDAGIKPESVSGSSDSEIDSMAHDQGVHRVPAAVREVLRLIGRKPGLWLAGSTFGTKSVRSKEKNYATLILARFDHSVGDAAEMLVLTSHGSYEYQFIDGVDLELDDPPVWRVVEGSEAARTWSSVTEWFNDITPDVAAYKERLEILREMGERCLPPWAEDIRLD